jgi:hypothetical protein
MSWARSGVPWERGGPRLAPPAGAVRLNAKAGLITLWLGPGNRTVLSVQKPWFDGCFYTEAGGQDPRGGPLAPPRGVQRLALPRTWSWQAVKAAPASGCRRLAGSRQCVGDHLLPVTGGTYESRCRRLGSPQSSPEVPAETQEGPAGTGKGWGHSGRIGVRGPAAGGAGQERGRPPPRPVDISAQVRSVTAGAGLAFHGRLAGAPRPLPGGRYCRTWERPGVATPSRRTRRTD